MNQVSVRRAWIVFSILISLAFIIGGFSYYSVEKSKIRLAKYDEIASVAELKIGEIQNWRSERIEDAVIISKGPLYVETILNLLHDRGNKQLEKTAKERLALEKNLTFYSDAFILDATGQRLVSLDTSFAIDTSEKRSFQETILERKPVMTDLFRGADGKIHIDVMAPVFDKSNNVAAVVVLQSDAENFIYPLINSWPVPSRSAETLLLEKRKDEIVFLSNLRYSSNAAFSFRQPLTMTMLPAMQAALGKVGMFEGMDYRGAKVLADLRPVPGTPWFMVAKVDESEILSEIYYREGAVILIVLLLIGISVAATAYVYRREKASMHREMYQTEAALHESQRMMRAVLDTVPVRVFWKDKNGIYLGCNLPFASDSGFDSPDEIVGKDDFQMGWRQQAELYRADDKQVIESGISKVAYEEPQSFDKGTRWLRTSKVPLRNAEGEIIGVLGTYEDVTATKQAAIQLAYERYLLNALMENTVDPIYFKDLEGRFMRVSSTMAAKRGLASADQLLGRTDFDFIMRDSAHEIRKQELEIIRTGKPVVDVEIEEMWLDRPPTWASVTKVPLHDQSGKIVGLFGVSHNITDRKNAEIALRESEEKFRGLVEGSSVAIWIHDGNRFLYANPAALKMTGYTAEELSTLSPAEFVHPDYRELVMKRAEERIDGKEVPRHYEYQILKKSGDAIWIDFSGATIDYRGKQAIIASAYDITERKKLEEQLLQSQKMEGIGRLAGGVAHDYNNMLSVIIGYGEMLATKMNKGDPLYRYAEFIAAAAKRGADITKQLLAFARREIVSPLVLNPNDAIDSLGKMFESLIGENIELTFIPAQNVWNIKIDPTQLDQILVNLATNSRDAIDNTGTIIIETSNVHVDEAYAQNHIDFSPGEYVVISFTDSGRGISKETMEKIFEPFFTTKSKGQGTGLGLSTLYGIVKQNGGSINVYSEVGQGTTFKIYLPRHKGDVQQPEETQEEEEPVGGTETILVVEDRADLLELVKNTLQMFGYKVLTALSPAESIQLGKAYYGEIDLLLTDVVMPGMNGKELRNKIQTIRPNIKTIFMSGYTANVIAHEGVLDKGVDFIQKPFTSKALARKVREILKG